MYVVSDLIVAVNVVMMWRTLIKSDFNNEYRDLYTLF